MTTPTNGLSSLRGKVTIVTGSSSGIGRGIAVSFAQVGAKLVLTGRNVEGIEETRQLCLEAGLPEKEVNNAGVYPFVNFIEDTNDAVMKGYQDVFDINLTAIVDLTKKCLTHLIASKGNIVNISSILSGRVVPTSIFYSMTKAAVDMFTKGLAQEVGPKGVRVNSVNPGWTLPAMMVEDYISTQAVGAKLSEEQVTQIVRERSVFNRTGTPKEIANIVLFLASEAASFVTGSTYVVDGGALVK